MSFLLARVADFGDINNSPHKKIHNMKIVLPKSFKQLQKCFNTSL